MVVVWNTQNVRRDGDVSVLAKVHTDADIGTMKVASFDDTRFLNSTFMVPFLMLSLSAIDKLPFPLPAVED